MNDIKQIIANNLVELRKRKKWTQLDLATELQYSDKAISKWEKGDSLPDIEVLYQICQLYGVTLDYLTHEGNFEEKQDYVVKENKQNKVNKLMIVLLSALLVWAIAVVVYVSIKLLQGIDAWIAFVWAAPFTALILLIFNCIWGRRLWRFIILSILTWTFLAALYCIALFDDAQSLYVLWPIFLLGIPCQVAIVLWSQIKHSR